MSLPRSSVPWWPARLVGDRKAPLWIFLAVTAAIGTAYYAFPGHHLHLWTPLGLLSVAALVAGVRIHRPNHPMGWYVLAAGAFCFISGDTTYNFLTDVLGWDDPLPSVADGFYLLSYPLFATGLLLLIRRRTASGHWGWILDASIMTTACVLPVWIYLVMPLFEDYSLTLAERLVSAAYPLGDVLLLAMLARLITGGGLRNRATQLLAVGVGYLLASDVVFGLSQLEDGWERGGVTDLGWMVLYIAWGAASLHPSMREITATPVPTSSDVRLGRIVALAAVGLIAPALLVLDAAHRSSAHAVSIGMFAAALYLLVLIRLADIVAVHRQSLARERILRANGESLLTAQDAEDVIAAALAAVDLLTANVPDVASALYLVGPDDVLRVAASSGADLGEIEPLWAQAVSAGSGSGLQVAGPLSINALRYDQALRGMLVVRAGTALPPDVHGAVTSLAFQVALALGSERLASELHQRQQEVLFGNLIQNSSDIILVISATGEPTYGMDSLQRVLGLATMPATDQLLALCHPDDEHTAVNHVIRMRTRPAGELTTDYWRLRHADGAYRSFEVMSRNMLEDPTVAGVVLTMRDVSQRRALEEQLKHQAFHDGLTDIANRELFQDRAALALSRIAKTPELVAMVMLDLDDFKDVNDAHGHGIGDEVLRAVANRLGSAMRPGDTAARLGGDEFAVLVQHVPDVAAAELVVTRLLHTFDAPFTVMDQLFVVRASAGLVVVGGDDDIDLAELLLRADLALYASKDDGKGGFRRYEPALRTDMLLRVTRRTELKSAVENDEFVLRYQPIVEIDTGQVVGFEALVRWEHPHQGTIQPNEFIALAEETGLIVPLGRWVLDTACAQIGLWRGTSLAGFSVSVNVSGLQLQEPTFVNDVRAALLRNGIEPRSLVLELTETVLFHNEAGIPESLSELKALGVGVAIDDFGTGYSSLAYLRRYAVDIIKIDKSFIDGLGTGDNNAKALVRAVVSLAHEMRLRIVAEGIERAAQADELRSLGCELGQGYLYAKPLAAAELTELFRDSTQLPGPVTPGLLVPLRRSTAPSPVVPASRPSVRSA